MQNKTVRKDSWHASKTASRDGAHTSARAASLATLKREIRALADPERARASAWYFKTGPGEYGHGDRFLGLTAPQARAVARRHRDLPLAKALALLRSPVHEDRGIALLILVDQYGRTDARAREEIVAAYLAHTRWVNNWDLVDLSAPRILGLHLLGRSTRLLDRLAASPCLWERRIAVLATFAFIRDARFEPSFRLAARLMDDREDLIHKAVGWMLREVGHRDLAALRRFLAEHAAHMPRTMLRYAIEKMTQVERRKWMAQRGLASRTGSGTS